MKISEMKAFFSKGMIKSVSVSRQDEDEYNGYWVIFYLGESLEIAFLTHSAVDKEGVPVCFKSIDGAANQLLIIGIKEFEVFL